MKIGNVDIPVNRKTVLWGGAGIAAIAALLYIRSQTTADDSASSGVDITGYVPGSLIFDGSGSLAPGITGNGSNTVSEEQIIYELLNKQLELERDTQAATTAGEAFQYFLSLLSAGDFQRAFNLFFKTPWGTQFEFNYSPVGEGQSPIGQLPNGLDDLLADFYARDNPNDGSQRALDNAHTREGLPKAEPTFDNIMGAFRNAVGILNPVNFAIETAVGQLFGIESLGLQDAGGVSKGISPAHSYGGETAINAVNAATQTAKNNAAKNTGNPAHSTGGQVAVDAANAASRTGRNADRGGKGGRDAGGHHGRDRGGSGPGGTGSGGGHAR